MCKCFSLAIEKSLLLQLHIFSSIRPALCFDGEGRERRRKKNQGSLLCRSRRFVRKDELCRWSAIRRLTLKSVTQVSISV